MRTEFWRFAYDDESLKEILASDKLVFPNLGRWPSAKNDTEEKITHDLMIEHFILLANYNRTSETGTVRGVGKVINLENPQPLIQWKKPIPSWSLHPNRRGGVQQWENEGVFCFDVEPAKRYNLDSLTKKLFSCV